MRLFEFRLRRTLVYLILTLNQVYPDYDFTALRAHQFSKEESIEAVQHKIDIALSEAARLWTKESGYNQPSLQDSLWLAIDEVSACLVLQ